ncbi:Ltp family lipoprotein [Mycobacterium sp. SMC-14]|uniref:Ltp family lipoprotein n=1 Tax=Mycobacterium sp. SMC-14 TaxID=3385968 RepID=UPI00390C84F0
MNQKPLAALAALGFLVIGGIAAGTTSAAPLGPAQPLSPVSQANAVSKAREYLEVSAFSRQGLIEQLEYSQFSTDDATSAVDSLNIDWNEQAAKKAKEYLEVSSFSRGGLIEQLEYGGFTPEQAEYGVATTGL